ncbi:MAG TPA: transglutaminase-like domain-containing protein [Thermoanaerobaculia bacterium]|nr:transglutaminase-like domain-containing protein [Thermoanaerobaculia bacterium]
MHTPTTPPQPPAARELRRRFTELVCRPEAEIDLAEAALLISAEENPQIEVARWLTLLDELAEEVRPRLESLAPGPGADLARLERLRRFLFEEKGFRGNCDDYYDPANSFLDQVLEHRRGIPISLALVLIEVGRRVGVPLVGVGFPGHFLVRHALHPQVLLDPFEGRVLTPEDCRGILDRICGGHIPFHPRLLAPVSTRCMLLRMLNNLRGIYLARGELARALAVLDRILLLAPDDAVQLRERALVHLRLGNLPAALADFSEYLETEPEAPDRESVGQFVDQVRGTFLLVN